LLFFARIKKVVKLHNDSTEGQSDFMLMVRVSYINDYQVFCLERNISEYEKEMWVKKNNV